MKLFDKEQIQTRLKELAQEINKDFKEVTLLIALTGGVYTAIDLSKYITIPCKLEFVKISSYGNSQESGIIDLKWISAQKGKDLGNILIIDDICDTGKTLDYLIKYIRNNFKYNDIKTLTLLNKPSRREIPVQLDYNGFTIDNLFVYGYGLDDAEYKRNITEVQVKEN